MGFIDFTDMTQGAIEIIIYLLTAMTLSCVTKSHSGRDQSSEILGNETSIPVQCCCKLHAVILAVL